MAYKILIADDEAEIRDLLKLYLENEGYAVIEAADGEGDPLTGVKITGYRGDSAVIRIPATIDGQQVLAIDAAAFPAGSQLYLPGTLAQIDAEALEGFLLYAPEGSETALLLADAGLEIHAAVHTLSFDANGGALVPSMEVQAGTELSVLPDTVQDGREFQGWFLDAALTRPAVTAEEAFRMPDGDTLLYAGWSGNAADWPFLWEQRGQEIVITGSSFSSAGRSSRSCREAIMS